MQVEELLVLTETGYGWKSINPQFDSLMDRIISFFPSMVIEKGGAYSNCVVARALRRPVSEPSGEAKNTKLGRELSIEESASVYNMDMDEGTASDRDVVLKLAEQMGL